MESPTVQITQRLIAAHSNVALGNIVRGEFDPYQFEKVSNTIATLKTQILLYQTRAVYPRLICASYYAE